MKITIKFVKYQNSSILKEKHFYWIYFPLLCIIKKFLSVLGALKSGLLLHYSHKLLHFIYMYIYIYIFISYIYTHQGIYICNLISHSIEFERSGYYKSELIFCWNEMRKWKFKKFVLLGKFSRDSLLAPEINQPASVYFLHLSEPQNENWSHCHR